MSLENSLKNIKKYFVRRYKNNLAAILIFGSANTGQFIEGKSDVDAIILFKKQDILNLEKELKGLFETEKLKKEKLKILHFKTLKEYERHIYEKGSWSSWITVINGSRRLYSTPKFQEFKKRLISKPIPKNKLKKYIEHKDKFELEGYIKKDRGFKLTKDLMSHIRRKLQIINYFENKKIIFDYERCLGNIDLEKEKKEKLEKLYDYYILRKRLPNKEVKDYYRIAKELTNRISNY